MCKLWVDNRKELLIAICSLEEDKFSVAFGVEYVGVAFAP